MVVVLKTESEDMKLFFQGRDELKVLLYQQPLMSKRDILRVDVMSLFFKLCASVTHLVVIGHGTPPKKRQCAQQVPKPHTAGTTLPGSDATFCTVWNIRTLSKRGDG